MAKSFFDKKIDEVFALIEEWRCLTGKYFDLNKTYTPSVIFLGFPGCPPCRRALPVYAAVSLEEKYGKYNFLYLTFDDSLSVLDEFGDLRIQNNNKIRIISLPEKYIKENGMVYGYPIVYFLNSEKIVKIIYAYGEYDGPLDSKQYWVSMRDSLR